MARVLRSKTVVIAEEDTQVAAQVHLPDTPAKPRTTLGERNNNTEAPVTIADIETENQLKALKAAYKTALGVKKIRKGKKNKKVKEHTIGESGVSEVVLEDQQTALLSHATSKARQILTSDEEHTLSVGDEQTAFPAQTVRTTRRQLEAQPAITELSEAEVQNQSKEVDKDEDIKMTPLSPISKSAIVTLKEIEKTISDLNPRPIDNKGDDSFLEQITLRSPAKPAPRIEDSVEELDKIAEVEEALHEVTLAEQMVTEKTKKVPISREKAPRSVRSKVDDTFDNKISLATGYSSLRVKSKDTLKSLSSQGKSFSSLRVKSKDVPHVLVSQEKRGGTSRGTTVSPSRRTVGTINLSEVFDSQELVPKKPVKRPASLLPPKQTVRAARPPTVSTFELPGEAVARRLKEQREARQAQREAANDISSIAPAGHIGPRIKSAKPPTKPTFELPGEAVSRRKREVHEARLRTQEDEEKKRREFKAKPLRKSIVPEIRETAASRARKSQIGLGDQNVASTHHSYNSLSISKRSSIVGAHRLSILALNNVANVSAPRAPGPDGSQAILTRKPATANELSMSGLARQRVVSINDTQILRQRAKVIYNRDIKALEDVEREKREREAAAKKSREEAAERGRQASREWAEKQRAKKAAEGDKGMSAGYGPGGQIGLKA